MATYVHYQRHWSSRPKRGLRRFIPITLSAPVEAAPISAMSRRVAEPPWRWSDHAQHSHAKGSQWRNPRRFVPIVSTATSVAPSISAVSRRAGTPPWQWHDHAPFAEWRNPRRFVPKQIQRFHGLSEASRRIAVPPWSWSHHAPFAEWRNPRRFVPIVSTVDPGAPYSINNRRIAVAPWKWLDHAPHSFAKGQEWRNPRRFLPIISTAAVVVTVEETGETYHARARMVRRAPAGTLRRPTAADLLDMPMQDDGTATTLDDVSVANNDPTGSGTRVTGPNSRYTYALSAIGAAFDTRLAPLNVYTTISFWAKGSGDVLSENSEHPSLLELNSAAVRIITGEGFVQAVEHGVTVTDWHHYAIAVGADIDSSRTLYVDGEYVGVFSGDVRVVVSFDAIRAAPSLAGLKIYDSLRTADEILAEYHDYQSESPSESADRRRRVPRQTVSHQ